MDRWGVIGANLKHKKTELKICSGSTRISINQGDSALDGRKARDPKDTQVSRSGRSPKTLN